jgi:hypothetical protein
VAAQDAQHHAIELAQNSHRGAERDRVTLHGCEQPRDFNRRRYCPGKRLKPMTFAVCESAPALIMAARAAFRRG